jgi:flagellar hook-associated protein 3 FlgL
MRISTNMIFDAGVANINKQMAAALKLQEQIAANKRIIHPSDDPVAAAQALQVQQAKDINAQYDTTLGYAQSSLSLEEAQLGNVVDIFGRLKELVVQASNGTLKPEDRNGLAVELRARFSGLLSIANSTDGAGKYMFAGYKGDTQPFSGTVEGGVAYAGDDGQRRLQVSPTRQIETSDAGSAVFGRITNGNGVFSTTYGAGNSGTGVINGGAVSDPAAWVAPTAAAYTLVFTSGTTYEFRDGATVLSSGTYTSGAAIPLQNGAVSLGATVTVTGAPAAGDTFAIAPSRTDQSLFTTLANLIQTVEGTGTTPADVARYQVDVRNAMNDIERARINIVQVRAAVGARLSELGTVAEINSDVDLQHADTLSNLQDLDMVKALTALSRKQTDLEAAQKSFTVVAGLSLFNYL